MRRIQPRYVLIGDSTLGFAHRSDPHDGRVLFVGILLFRSRASLDFIYFQV